VPVTVGAAADGVVQRGPSDTPAGKAAALRPPPEETEEDLGEEPPGTGARRGRMLLLLLLVALLVAGGAYGAYRWSQTQYYVGAQGGNVAIFRGLTQDVGPLDTSRLYSAEDVALADLPTYQRERVEADITTRGLTHARRIVETLREQAELCRRQAAAAPAPSPSPSPSPTGSPSGPTSASATPTPSPSPTASGDPAARDCGDGS
jgi:protein phosphatase